MNHEQTLLLGYGKTWAPAAHERLAPRALTEFDYEEENVRYEEIREVASTGNGVKLEELLGQWEKRGWLRDWRNDENLTLYADAITDGYLEIVNAFLNHDVPLGDALIRAIDVEFDEAIRAICRYIEQREDLRESVLNGSSDNDDFHPAITPLILAAQRNNFGTVKLLVELGAEIEEPSISQGGDVTLTQALSTLHMYRALSQPAYILATKTDIFGHAFEMSKKLKTLSRTWEDFGAEYEQLASGVEVFAGEMLGQSGSTEEILALFRYHNTDKYRDLEGKQHPLAKLFEAIDYQQKEFIAHPHSQKAIIAQFYRNLLDWSERGFLYQLLLALFVLLGYPVISLLYILVPVRRVVNFARLPYVMMMMKAGSGFTFLTFIIAVTVIDAHDFPRTTKSLHSFILVWVIGLIWLHVKLVVKRGGRHYLSDNANIHELVIIGLCVIVACLHWTSGSNMTEGAPPLRPVREVSNGAYLGNDAQFSDLQNHISSALGDVREKLKDDVTDGINGILVKTLSSCRRRNGVATSVGNLANGVEEPPSLRPALTETMEQGQFEPNVVAGALFGVMVTVSVLRLLNITLVSDSIGPLRISLGAMSGDILKFLGIFVIIWFAFAIGLSQNFYSAGRSAARACIGQGEDPENCRKLVGFSTFFDSVRDLYWALYGLTGISVLVLPGKQSVAEGVGTMMFLTYVIMAVVVLLNALIGMLSNTYNRTEEHEDTEWKFHRAAVWAYYLRPVGTLPPPFNLIPSVKSLYRFLLCTVRKTRHVTSKKDVHNKKELEDYKRVLKLVSNRYIRANLSTESQNTENVRPRDLQTLRNDILAFKFNVQDRLESLSKTLGVSSDKTGNIHEKLEDLYPLSDKVGGLLDESAVLTDKLVSLKSETGELHKTQDAEIAQRDQELSQQRDTMANLRDEVRELSDRYTIEVADRKQLEAKLNGVMLGLEEETTRLTDTVRGLTEDKTNLTRQVDGLREEAQISREETTRLEDTVSALEAETKQLSDTTRKLQEEKTSLADAVRALEKEKAELKTKVGKVSTDDRGLYDQPSGLKYMMGVHRVEIEKLTNSHTAEMTARDKREKALNNTIRKLEKEAADFRDSVRALDKDKAKLIKQVDELQKEARNFAKVSSEMRASIDTQQTEIKQLKLDHSAELAARDNQEAKLDGTIRDLQEENSSLTSSVHGLSEDKGELERTVKELREEIQNLTSK